MLNGARQVRITSAQRLRRKDMNILSFQCVWWLVLSFIGLFVAALEKEIFSNDLFDNFLEDLRDLSDVNKASVRFSLRNPSQPDDDVCYIVRGKPETLNSCNFKNTSKTFLVIHGWTVSGLFESWVEKLVAALYNREKDANVIVVDWLDTAQNHYVVAAQNTKMVGQETGLFIDWLEETARFPLEKLHLIGYSLGAHVAGFAGNHATNKVGRITGLDPAGPDFEGVHAHGRLSPDDAHFVDVLHTFTRGSLGLSIGIKQPVGHVDIYPNGGSFQPGCNMRGALEKIASYGILVFHYQLKINFLGKINQLAMEPALTVSLYGTNGEAEDLKLNIQEKITPNKTHSFLVVTEKDTGDLLMLKFKLEESTSSLLTLLSSWWYGDSANSGIQVHKIRVRVGETQKKIVLCLKDPQTGSSTQDVAFVKCKEPWRSLSKRPKLKSQ
ncbi:lipoprotein lipase-like isoform X2 [Sinocyclocheilus grahami]|uniref:lipoprotein lipase-like isoform X2 n=1 Tax=Sinocyclocheilus grahami TaxID=75366 RepID=UPI0007ACE293|nr:PREDICTED: lipoprotein lipase-like isoform X2 [Sinocyclocheilus grahami]